MNRAEAIDAVEDALESALCGDYDDGAGAFLTYSRSRQAVEVVPANGEPVHEFRLYVG